MNIEFVRNGGELNISLEGRLDTTTAPEFESFINKNIEGVELLHIDCARLEYVSSAGLRVLLAAQKKMKSAMKITNVCELVMEVFEMTGFAEILNIE